MLNHIQRRLILQAKVREVIRKGVGVMAQKPKKEEPKK